MLAGVYVVARTHVYRLATVWLSGVYSGYWYAHVADRRSATGAGKGQVRGRGAACCARLEGGAVRRGYEAAGGRATTA